MILVHYFSTVKVLLTFAVCCYQTFFLYVMVNRNFYMMYIVDENSPLTFTLYNFHSVHHGANSPMTLTSKNFRTVNFVASFENDYFQHTPSLVNAWRKEILIKSWNFTAVTQNLELNEMNFFMNMLFFVFTHGIRWRLSRANTSKLQMQYKETRDNQNFFF